MIKAVVFDFGGVLVRTGDPISRRAWESRLGLTPGMLERAVHGSDVWIQAQQGKLAVDDYWRAVAADLGILDTDIPSLRVDYFRDDTLDPVLVDLIKGLRQSGYKVGLLSNDAVTLEQKLRTEFAIYDLFDAVVISAHIGVMKPNAEAYQAIATALDVLPAECVFIDDNAANIEGAQRVGMKAIHYLAGMDVQPALDKVLKETV